MFLKFVMWFIGGLVVTATVQILIGNVFVTSFIVGAMMGILGARE